MFYVVHKNGESYFPKQTQLEADHLFQGPDFDISLHLHDTLFVFLVAMFYLPLLPVGTAAALVAYFTNIYYVKLKLLTQHCKPVNLDQKIIINVTSLIPWMVYCACLMQLFYVRWVGWYMESI